MGVHRPLSSGQVGRRMGECHVRGIAPGAESYGHAASRFEMNPVGANGSKARGTGSLADWFVAPEITGVDPVRSRRTTGEVNGWNRHPRDRATCGELPLVTCSTVWSPHARSGRRMHYGPSACHAREEPVECLSSVHRRLLSGERRVRRCHAGRETGPPRSPEDAR